MPRRYYFVLSLIILVATFLRLWQLAAVPAGLHYDLAATALLGNEVAFHGYRPIFISAYTGHEALFYYWLALWFRLAGSSVFTLRLAAATLGVLAVPAAFFALRETMRFERELALPLAALAAAFLATAFFHVTFSRFGFRVIVEPVVQALALGFLFRGLWGGGPQWRTGGVRQFFASPGLHVALGGAFTGLAAYTYLAARFFPLPLAVFWAAYLIGAARRGVWGPLARRAYGQLAAFTAAALAVFAPLGIYFLRHPEDFLNRAGQVAPRAGETALLLDGLRRAAEMVFINGEPYDRYNLPGLPLFGPLLGFFFVIGLLITLRNIFLPAPSRDATVRRYLPRATELLLAAWLPAMLLPTALAVHDIYPSNLRAFGLIPLLFVFPARGLQAAYRWVQRWWPGPLIPYAYPLMVVTLAALVFGGYTTGRQYFGEWARLPSQPQNNDADLTGIAAYLNAQSLDDTAVYVSAIHYRHPALAFLARDYDSIHWLTGGTALALPEGRPALYLFARSAPPPEEWIASWASHQVAAPLDPDGTPSYRAYRFEAGETPPLPEFNPLDINFGNAARLTGYQVITSSTQVLLDLRWQIDNVPDAGDYLPYARLTDEWGSGWAQSGGFSYPSEQWQPGDTVLTRLSLPLPAGLPPGVYSLKAGLYSAGKQQNLPHLDAGGAFAGERAIVTTVELAGGGPEVTLETLKDFQQANGMAPVGTAKTLCVLPGGNGFLLGANLERAAVRQGEWLHPTLYWAAPFTPGENALTITLGGQTLYSGQPVHGSLPFNAWPPNSLLIDRYALKVPADIPPGDAAMQLSMSGGRCEASLGVVSVEAVERVFTPPAMDYAAPGPSSLGGTAMLVGYSFSPGQPAGLRLVWQALAPMAADYTVFVHVLDQSGQIAAQADAQPRGGTYPTSMWEPGEYVVDDYSFDLPPGEYNLHIGMYLAETGMRLPVDGAGEAQGVILLPRWQVP